jgi:hypothetical protein
MNLGTSRLSNESCQRSSKSIEKVDQISGSLNKKKKLEQSRAEQSRAEQSRAEQSRAEQSRAEQSRAEQLL